VTESALSATLWEGHPVAYWQQDWHVPALHVFTVVGSTNDVARTLAAQDAAAGTIVLAERQTAGRGRHGRRWLAPEASSLLLSCLLRPHAESDAVPGTIPLRVGLAAAVAIETATGVHVALKWPNDLVRPGAGKLGGVLCEAATTGDDHWSVVAGIGINVRPREWPAELRGIATSLDEAAGVPTDRARLAGALVDGLRPLFTAPFDLLSAGELAAFRVRDALADNTVIVEEVAGTSETRSARQRTGTSAGIAPDGALLLRTDSGIERITTGTVRVSHEPGPRSTPTYP
jgi:BirA family biotin operon repressor/biotin-[acetyl-CoA-carboxylase] ligase